MALMAVDEALAALLHLVKAPDHPEFVDLRAARGRILATPLMATRTQPPTSVSAMDGYCLRDEDAHPGACLDIIGVSSAGEGFKGSIAPGTCVRILTGAPVPEGGTTVIIQENVDRQGDAIQIDTVGEGRNIRAAGKDFTEGDMLLAAGLDLCARHIALAAAGGHARLPVWPRPRIAILMTGDELVMPGDPAGPHQIVASNGYGVAALAEAAGAVVAEIALVRDDLATMVGEIERLSSATDLVITIGGASVGDRDYVKPALDKAGFALAVHRIAMRPGKPLMFARNDQGVLCLGLPGNPVSALVTAQVFLKPLIAVMQGTQPKTGTHTARLLHRLEANGDRRHYMRAILQDGAVRAVSDQDSSLLGILGNANALIVHEAMAPARESGEEIPVIALDL